MTLRRVHWPPWRHRLLLTDVGAALVVAPWHRWDQGPRWFLVPAAVWLCGPLFAWLLLARSRRLGVTVAVVLLGALAATFLLSQILLAGPVRPPMVDWAVPFVVLTGPVVVAAAGWQEYSAPAAERPGWWARAGAVAVLALTAMGTWGAYEFASVGEDEQPITSVDPYAAEVLPLPSGWTVRRVEVSAGSSGPSSLTVMVTRKGPVDPLVEQRRLQHRLRELGWRRDCEPVGGLLHIVGVVDWGCHCVSVHMGYPGTARIEVDARPGHRPPSHGAGALRQQCLYWP